MLSQRPLVGAGLFLHRMAPSNLSRYRRWMPSWDAAVPPLVQRIWHDEDVAQIVRDVVPRHAQRILGMRAGVERNDMARYCLLYRHGGMYADLDVQLTDAAALLRVLQIAARRNWVVLPFENNRLVGQCIMLSPRPRHPFWLELIERLVSEYDPRCYEPSTTGSA